MNVTGLTATDTVPANTTYDASCTQNNLPTGVTATYNATANTVTFTDSNAYVVSATVPQTLATYTLCTNIVTTTNPGVVINNTATTHSNEAPASVTSNQASLTVQGPGRLAIGESVDKQVISSGDSYAWTLKWANNSSVSFAGPQIIDVLPYNGDGSSGAASQRNIGGSSFSGTNALTGPLTLPTFSSGSTDTGTVAGTWYYTTATPSSIIQNPGDASNASPGTGSSIWVPAASITDWSAVTGVYFSSSGFFNGGDTATVQIPMRANAGTQLGDIYVNQAELYTSTAPNNPVVTNDPYTQIPGLQVVKTASTTTVSTVGQQVTYTFTVSNLGRVSLNNVSVTDTQTAPSVAASLGPITCQSLANPVGSCSGTTLATLGAGQVATFQATYAVTQADVDHGTLGDSALANAVTNPGGIPVTSQTSPVSVTATQSPAITIAKSVSPTQATAVGQQMTYNFLVTNTGNVTLSHVAINDQQTAPSVAANMGTISCPSTTLAPGAATTCTATYTVSQADANAGTVNDTATAQGTAPGATTPTISGPSAATITIPPAPAITVTKTVSSTTVHNVGDTVTYTFVAKNTGNVSLSNVSVVDTQTAPATQANLSAMACQSLASPTGTCSGTTAAALPPGQSATFQATYTVTQADLDHGTIGDSATSQGTAPGATTPTVSQGAPATGTATQSPAMTMSKTVSPTVVHAAGDTVTYTFVATNTGNVTMSNVSINDVQTAPAVQANLGPVTCQSLATPTGTCSGTSTTLAPGQSATFTATYTVSQADANYGSANDAATAQGTAPGATTPTVSQASTAVVSIPADPGPDHCEDRVPAERGAGWRHDHLHLCGDELG